MLCGQKGLPERPFSSTIRNARVESLGPVVRDPLAELEAILPEQ
jgi:hypothetical protein